MKKLLFALTLLFTFAQAQYTFLVKKYTKEIELEAKIIANIAKNLSKEKSKIFIPKIKEQNHIIYSKFLNIVNTCEEAEIVYVKDSIDKLSSCKKQNKIYFTNNYRLLLSQPKFIGAFFWSKSRPNIVFIKSRLKENNIIVPKNYEQFVEEF